MIIVRLIGGLCNQFFQDAVGRYLAEKHNTDLKIDISGFETYKLHKYSLFPFNIKEDVATAEEVSVFTQHKQGFINGVFTKLFCRSARSPSSHVQEKHFHFDHDILNLSDNVYLDGYWQSEDYFKIVMVFASGLVAQADATQSARMNLPVWFVMGTKGTLITEDNGTIAVGAEIRTEIDGQPTIVKPKVFPKYWQGFYDNFAKAYRGQEPLVVLPSEAREVVRVLEAAQASAQTGHSVSL